MSEQGDQATNVPGSPSGDNDDPGGNANGTPGDALDDFESASEDGSETPDNQQVNPTNTSDAEPPATRTRAKSKPGTSFVALTTFSGREAAAQKRGDEAAKLNHVRDLLLTAQQVVEAVTIGNARDNLTDEEIQHDVREMTNLRQELSAFDVNSVARTWRAKIGTELTQQEAALATASAMLERRAPSSSSASAVGSPTATNAATTSTSTTTTPPTQTQANVAAAVRSNSAPTSPRKTHSVSRAGACAGGGTAINHSGGNSAPTSPTRARTASVGAGGGRGAGRRGGGRTRASPAQPKSTRGRGALSQAQSRLMSMAYGAPGTRGAQPTPLQRPTSAPPMSAPPPGGAGTQNQFSVPPPPLPTAPVNNPTACALTGGSAGPPGGASLSFPSWQATPQHPYAPNTCNLGNEYYLAFPYPWNSVPQTGEVNVGNILKVGTQALPKFNGDRRSYITWRGSFIPGVHLKPIDVSYKILLLRGCMLPTNARMREFIDSIVATPEGYRQAVVTLEERYGGAAALLMTRQEALMALPELREGEFRLLETLHGRLRTFLLEWEGITGTPLNDRESLSYYLSLMAKMEHNYSRKYLEWVENNKKTENLQSLYEWITGELQRHRRVEIYALQKTRSGARGTTGETPRAARVTPPPSTLDRNYQGQRGFLAAWEEGQEQQGEEVAASEEVVADSTGEGLEEVACAAQTQSSSRPPPRPPCTLCQEDHGLGRCEKFRALSPSDRKALLVKEGRCFLCFQKGHSVARCRFSFKCVQCGRRHHTLIHGADVNSGSVYCTMEEEEEDYEGAAISLSYGMLAQGRDESPPAPTKVRVSLRTVPVHLINPFNGKMVETNAMLDDGCTGSAILDEALARELGLKGQVRWTSTEGVGGHVTRYQTVYTCVKVVNAITKAGFLIPAQVMKQPAGTYQPIDWSNQKKHFSHLAPLPLPAPVAGVGVGIMIGNQNPSIMVSREEVIGDEADPVARRTLLGWTVVGPVLPGGAVDEARAQLALLLRSLPRCEAAPPPFAEGQLVAWEKQEDNCVLLSSEPTDRQLVKLLQRMLEVENPGEAVLLSPQEEFIVKQARNTLMQGDRQYQVGCTWAPGGGRPPLARKHAEERLRGLERGKYFRQKHIKEAYQKVIDHWEKEGFVKDVSSSPEQVKHLLPHFPILKDSETTPVRPVMDCSTELNKHLLAGPNLINGVPEVLLRFRSGLISFSGDVKQMFLRILLAPQDKPYHCFLWRDPANNKIKTYQFQVHVFGNAGSPFLAVFVLREHARKYSERFPQVTETILQSTLIDDVLDSVDTVAEARKALLALKEILGDAGMHLAKAHSNSAQVLQVLKTTEIAAGVLNVSAVCHKEPSLARLKALGIVYDPVRDTFKFTLSLESRPRIWTKRWVLKTFPRLYDPLGLVLPFVILARMLFSHIATKDYSWDAPLSGEHQRTWEKWLAQLPTLEHFSVPRCIKIEVPTVVELHIFSDASSTVYAAVAYLKCEYEKTLPSSRLICARAHVVPVGKLSVPRLELLAADLAVQLREQVLRTLKLSVDRVHHWTDSTTVLYWLHNEKHRLQLFVYNKVSRIQAATNLSEWHWVPTAANPADIPSRGCSAQQLIESKLWKTGPEFLLEPKLWPVAPILLTTPAVLAEMKKGEQITLLNSSKEHKLVLDWERIPSWSKALRLVMSLLSWRDKVRRRLSLPPLSDVYKRAEKALVRQAQCTFHPPSTRTAKHHWQRMGFSRLPPLLDGEGLWRGQGRLSSHETLPLDVREPLLLPKKHRIAELLLRHLHERVLHHTGGVNHLLSRFQSRFWLPHARAFAFGILKRCVACRRRKATPTRPPEGQLPHFRLPPLEAQTQPVAFAVTALDCAGPFRVKRGRSYETHYLLLITCCQIRAVKLEYLSDLSVDALLLALTRASARGVNPHTILSDNGGNFDGANRLLRALWQALPQEQLESRRPEIRWRFNPPYASHYGGVFERLIKAAKEALYHVLPSHLSLTLEELQTAFAVVEGVLNTRPLAYTSTDGRDYAPITPNHFLYGAASEPLLLLDASASLAKRWTNLQHMVEAFLKRFHREVRPHLQLVHAKRGGGRDLKVGDVVTFLLPSVSRMWPLARVERTFPGPDSRVRTVEVIMPQVGGKGTHYQRGLDKTYRRDVGDVALLLPAEAEQPVGSI